LSRRLDETHAITELLAAADTDAVDRALSALSTLPSVSSCADPVALASSVALPDNTVTRLQVAAVHLKLAESQAHVRLAMTAQGVAISRSALADARAIGYRPLIGEAVASLGKVLRYASDKESVPDLRNAMHIAAEVGDTS